MSTGIEQLKNRLYDIDALHTAISVMEWDQQCYMPRGGAAARGAQVGILSRMAHEAFVSEETLRLLEKASSEVQPDTVDGALVRVARRDYDIQTKIPASLVEEKSRLTSEAHEVWVEARKANDFGRFLPYLEKIVALARREADALGYRDHIYDALLDQYEEGATAADVRAMFDEIRGPLVDLVKKIAASPNQPDDSFLVGDW
ncbi:MAG: carboxypeptidase M32, partial [Fimbriimonadaceae bacterium]